MSAVNGNAFPPDRKGFFTMRGRRRMYRFLSASVALSCLTLGVVGTTGSAGATGVPALASGSGGTPACTFNGSPFPIVTEVSDGQKIAISCTGLPALHPYLMLQASLLIGIDPKAAALLSGGTPSAATLEAALAALPEVDAASLTPELSNLSGDLNFNYTIPSSQASDPNATCPPSEYEVNTGLIGCALAMIDLTTQKPVAAGSAVLEWLDYPFFPPSPGLTLSATKHLTAGQVLTVTDPGTTYWWLATLNSLGALLSGGAAPTPIIEVDFQGKHYSTVPAAEDLTITGASYDGKTLTPPSIEGTITVPSGLKGRQKVTVSYQTTLDGQIVALDVSQRVKF